MHYQLPQPGLGAVAPVSLQQPFWQSLVVVVVQGVVTAVATYYVFKIAGLRHR